MKRKCDLELQNRIWTQQNLVIKSKLVPTQMLKLTCQQQEAAVHSQRLSATITTVCVTSRVLINLHVAVGTRSAGTVSSVVPNVYRSERVSPKEFFYFNNQRFYVYQCFSSSYLTTYGHIPKHLQNMQ